ncbi:hypothetical protein CDAR_4701 [Caerostris darwini]|uniref:Uncharacterized protein n=1 Tax=Caerostris darwini TaxID=1538125 RepID=A0AAV4P3Y5_9ARAC|nr:hypothetical protein CDAR_4701 [Caerostris darwini]
MDVGHGPVDTFGSLPSLLHWGQNFLARTLPVFSYQNIPPRTRMVQAILPRMGKDTNFKWQFKVFGNREPHGMVVQLPCAIYGSVLNR